MAGLIYNIFEMYKSKKFLTNQNIIVDGTLRKKNLVLFIAYCILYFYIMNMCIFTMYFANKAGVNVGVITTITSINPFFTAFADYLMYKNRMQYFHFLGMVIIVFGSIFICMKGEDTNSPLE